MDPEDLFDNVSDSYSEFDEQLTDFDDDYLSFSEVNSPDLDEIALDLESGLGPVQELEYESLSQSDVQALIESDVQFLEQKFKLPSAACTALLRHHNWNCRTVLSLLQENITSQLELVGICQLDPVEWASKPHTTQCRDPKVTCSICGSRAIDAHSGSLMMATFPCSHQLCLKCAISYLQLKVFDGEIHKTRCPVDLECKVTISQTTMKSVLKLSSARLDHLNLLNFLSSSPNIRDCTSPYCDLLVRLHQKSKSSNVQCVCGNEFCFKCGNSVHSPIDCEIAQKWISLTEDADPTQQWIDRNTKSCPKCSVQIIRDQGCNHVKCSKCFFEFCWSCSRDWASHPGSYFNCLLVQGSKLEKQHDAKTASALERQFWHCLSHFQTYRELASSKQGSDYDEPLASLAMLISWAYAILFFLPDSSQKLLLEINLEEAEKVVQSGGGEERREGSNYQRKQLLQGRRDALLELFNTTKWSFNKAADHWNRPQVNKASLNK